MSVTATLLADAAGEDPRAGLRAASALRKIADQLERAQVRNARDAGWSWERIAAELGVSKQAVHKKHAPAGRA